MSFLLVFFVFLALELEWAQVGMWQGVSMVLLRRMLMWYGSDRRSVAIGIGLVVLRSVRRRVLVFRGRPVVVELSELEGRFFVSIRIAIRRRRRSSLLN